MKNQHYVSIVAIAIAIAALTTTIGTSYVFAQQPNPTQGEINKGYTPSQDGNPNPGQTQHDECAPGDQCLGNTPGSVAPGQEMHP
jgi:hypothetical protein